MKSARPETAKAPAPVLREAYFPTLIYYSDVEGADALNGGIRQLVYALRAADSEGIVRSNVRQAGAWHSGLDLHCHQEVALLVERVMEVARHLFGDLGYDPDTEPVLDNMWANVSPRGGYNRSHTHPNVLWSGVYYVQAPPGCGRIFFTDPRLQALVLAPRFPPGEQRKPEAWNEVYYEAIEGRMILFPAWLGHEVEPNMTERQGEAGDRISVSFNLFQRRKQGPGVEAG